MDEIKNIIPEVIDRLNERNARSEHDLDHIWLEVMKEEKQQGRIGGLKEGRLLVYVDSPARRYHFNMIKGRLLKKLQKYVPDIREIILKIGKDR